MDTVFYKKFKRHAHGKGLKGHVTHYCAGCGHGLAHKYLVEAIEALDIQDRAIAVSPVGCSVFLYYYLDIGNTQAAHGRASAVAIGHKVANPNSIVFSYQGDGDLASIGLAEIIQTAQLGLPISVIFINNAIYGMTGGQLAPTTLMQQRTSTSPMGRDRFMGEPLKVAEMIAQLDGPVYVERVALFNNKQRFRARKAIQKALKLQVENKGMALVEVLAECPTHLHISPEEAEKWVEENMVPVFPLGVKKDVDADSWFHLNKPTFDVEKVLNTIGAGSVSAPSFSDSFPAHIDKKDIAIKFAGAGGDGAQTVARLTCIAGINEGFDSTYIPSYGPESRGGTSYADVHLAVDEVLSPAAPEPHILVAFNAPSLDKFGPTVRQGGTIIYDKTVIAHPPDLNHSAKMIGIPLTQIATDLGNVRVKNIVALGALQKVTELFPEESFRSAMRLTLHSKAELIKLNEDAFSQGCRAVEGILEDA